MYASMLPGRYQTLDSGCRNNEPVSVIDLGVSVTSRNGLEFPSLIPQHKQDRIDTWFVADFFYC